MSIRKSNFGVDAQRPKDSRGEVFRADGRKLTRAELERFLAAPIDIRTRTKWEKALARLA